MCATAARPTACLRSQQMKEQMISGIYFIWASSLMAGVKTLPVGLRVSKNGLCPLSGSNLINMAKIGHVLSNHILDKYMQAPQVQ